MTLPATQYVFSMRFIKHYKRVGWATWILYESVHHDIQKNGVFDTKLWLIFNCKAADQTTVIHLRVFTGWTLIGSNSGFIQFVLSVGFRPDSLLQHSKLILLFLSNDTLSKLGNVHAIYIEYV